MFKLPQKFRITGPNMPDLTNNEAGYYLMVVKPKGVTQRVKVIASTGLGWEHVSVSREDRCPTWEEMCEVKAFFWDAEDCVIEYHPPETEYVNVHKNCLHLWRPIGIELPIPPNYLV